MKPSTSKNIATMSSQYTMQMDSSVPKCSSTSKNRCPFSAVVMPKRLFNIERCPELEIGRNSAKPCTRPKMIAFPMDMDLTPTIVVQISLP